ncbi:hypothetical protein BH09MYX1_BH09MYX1_48080 [soil metagenome]
MPSRPSGVPEDAVWNEPDREWELGLRKGSLAVGAWSWWREDGTLACRSTFDDDGALHGIAQRFHPNGETSLVAPYVHGKLHGKQIATRPSSGDSPEMRELLELGDVHRTEILHLDGVSQNGMATLYGPEGLFTPIACDESGNPHDFAAQLDKLRPGTALELLVPFLPNLAGKTPRSMIKALHYVCAAIVGGSLHRVQVEGRRGEKTLAIVPREAFDDGPALAVDRAVVRLSLPT